MKGKENPVELLVICAVMVILGVLGVVAGITRELLGSLDGLLMLFVSLLMTLIFGIMLLALAKGQGWLGGRRQSRNPSTPAPAAGN